MSTDSLDLSCGPWSATLSPDGVLSGIRAGDEEVLHALMFVVRDDAWGTVPSTVDIGVDRMDSEGFIIRITGHTSGGGVDLSWESSLTGSARGIRFVACGRAERDFRSNRIGFVALHPLAWTGRGVEIVHTDGRTERSKYPEDVSPHQPFRDIAAMRQDAAAGLVTIGFEGDVFESEDQRNWSDASYKTYSRPLELPYPVQWRQGQRFSQAVSLELEARGRAASKAPIEVPQPAEVERIEVTENSVELAAGVMVGPDDDLPALAPVLEELRPHHLRVDVEVDARGMRGEGRLIDAQSSGVPVELALHIGADPAAALDALAERLRVAAPLDALLVLDALAPATTQRAVAAVQRMLEVIPSPRALFVGTDDNLAELNRNRLLLDEVGADAVVFGLNPGVHDTRDSAMLETPDAVPAMVRTAGGFAGGSVVLDPLTLRPRRNIYRPGSVDRLTRDDASIDPRQSGGFAAAWLVATLEAATKAGVLRVTAFELSGPRGLTDGSVRHPAFAVLAGLSGGRIRRTRGGGPRVAALAAEDGPILRVFVANRTDDPVRVTLAGTDETRAVDAYSVEEFRIPIPVLEGTR